MPRCSSNKTFCSGQPQIGTHVPVSENCSDILPLAMHITTLHCWLQHTLWSTHTLLTSCSKPAGMMHSRQRFPFQLRCISMQSLLRTQCTHGVGTADDKHKAARPVAAAADAPAFHTMAFRPSACCPATSCQSEPFNCCSHKHPQREQMHICITSTRRHSPQSTNGVSIRNKTCVNVVMTSLKDTRCMHTAAFTAAQVTSPHLATGSMMKEKTQCLLTCALARPAQCLNNGLQSQGAKSAGRADKLNSSFATLLD
ncbi:hypothetical protein COO60DRAFT_1519633 [Scenedesmus sp. NREL 46B-D3]|nr:hypothetical protein COO60DRAFT_1519633 [Scenedesmus sp. NREL 46B-D3]